MAKPTHRSIAFSAPHSLGGKKRRNRNPIETRQRIINATKTLLAQEGVQAISLAKVARVAGVNRSTAYEYFQCRETLVDATLDAVGQELLQAFFTRLPVDRTEEGLNREGKRALDDLALFFVENARLAAIWLDQFTKRRSKSMPLVETWLRATEHFAESDYGRPGVDAEVLTISLLSTYLVWPLWINAESLTADERRTMALRLSNELLRHGLYGAMRPEKLSKLAQDLDTDIAAMQLRKKSKNSS